MVATMAAMKLIGLTGGIGSGKSTVAKLLKERGCYVIDADKIAREIVQPGQPALSELADAFGQDILNEDGSLNRGLLAQRAFADKQQTQKLNDITHPRINQRTNELIEAARDTQEFTLYDMPLLVDKGLHEDMDYTVVVVVEEDERVRRLVASRGLDADDARARIRAQVTDEQRRAVADFVIDNNGSVDELDGQVDKVMEILRGKI